MLKLDPSIPLILVLEARDLHRLHARVDVAWLQKYQCFELEIEVRYPDGSWRRVEHTDDVLATGRKLLVQAFREIHLCIEEAA